MSERRCWLTYLRDVEHRLPSDGEHEGVDAPSGVQLRAILIGLLNREDDPVKGVGIDPGLILGRGTGQDAESQNSPSKLLVGRTYFAM